MVNMKYIVLSDILYQIYKNFEKYITYANNTMPIM